MIKYIVIITSFILISSCATNEYSIGHNLTLTSRETMKNGSIKKIYIDKERNIKVTTRYKAKTYNKIEPSSIVKVEHKGKLVFLGAFYPPKFHQNSISFENGVSGLYDESPNSKIIYGTKLKELGQNGSKSILFALEAKDDLVFEPMENEAFIQEFNTTIELMKKE